MATIEYKFSDGHIEEIEVTEEFKAAYEFELAREKARYWKIYRQKEREGIPTATIGHWIKLWMTVSITQRKTILWNRYWKRSKSANSDEGNDFRHMS